jgi:pre-mRNA-splicing factor ISY1
VKELIAGEGEVAEELLKKTRTESRKEVNAAYFGYRDEEDGAILDEELLVERLLLKAAVSGAEIDEEGIIQLQNGIPDEYSIPSQKQIEQYLISRKQREIMNYFSA